MLFHMSIEKRGKTEHKLTEFVTGFAQLPEAGGALDQSVWTMGIFDQFRAGENAAAAKSLK